MLSHSAKSLSSETGRIKRLRDMGKPQYRLRIDDLRVFYDVVQDEVIVHGMTDKTHAAQWLAEEGEQS